MPGFHLGIKLITRIASPSKSGSTPRMILGSEIEPSLLTTNCTVTRPCVWFFCALMGYWMFFDRNCISPDMPPSGNSGIISTTSNTGLLGSLEGGFCHWSSMTIFRLVLSFWSYRIPFSIYLSFLFHMTPIWAFSKAMKEKFPFLSVTNDWSWGSLWLPSMRSSAPSTGFPSLSTTFPL